MRWRHYQPQLLRTPDFWTINSTVDGINPAPLEVGSLSTIICKVLAPSFRWLGMGISLTSTVVNKGKQHSYLDLKWFFWFMSSISQVLAERFRARIFFNKWPNYHLDFLLGFPSWDTYLNLQEMKGSDATPSSRERRASQSAVNQVGWVGLANWDW